MNEISLVMLENQNGKKFFVEKKNIKLLENFIKIFNLKVTYVKSNKIKPLDIKELSVAFCDQDYICEENDYRVVPSKQRTTLSIKGKST